VSDLRNEAIWGGAGGALAELPLVRCNSKPNLASDFKQMEIFGFRIEEGMKNSEAGEPEGKTRWVKDTLG
jgi:hypothetical protein